MLRMWILLIVYLGGGVCVCVFGFGGGGLVFFFLGAGAAYRGGRERESACEETAKLLQ